MKKSMGMAIENRTEKIMKFEEEEVVINFYLQKLWDTCVFLKYHNKVQTTAALLFKRFYLVNSIMDYDPKIIL